MGKYHTYTANMMPVRARSLHELVWESMHACIARMPADSESLKTVTSVALLRILTRHCSVPILQAAARACARHEYGNI